MCGFCDLSLFVISSFAIILLRKGGAALLLYFNIVFLLSCDCHCSVSLPWGCLWLYECGISWSYSLAFLLIGLENITKKSGEDDLISIIVKPLNRKLSNRFCYFPIVIGKPNYTMSIYCYPPPPAQQNFRGYTVFSLSLLPSTVQVILE